MRYALGRCKQSVLVGSLLLLLTLFGLGQKARAESIESKIERTRALMSSAEVKGVTESSGNIRDSALNMIRATGIFVGIILLGYYAAKRYLKVRPTLSAARGTILEKISIGPKSYLALVELDGGKFICGVGVDSITQVIDDKQAQRSAMDRPPVYLTQALHAKAGVNS